MSKKKLISFLIVIFLLLLGLLFIYRYTITRDVIALTIGIGIIFIAIFNMVLTIKYS